jgi:hypothetical protein
VMVQRTEDVQVWEPPSSKPVTEPEPAPIGLPSLPVGLNPKSPTQWFTILAQRPL